MDDKRRQHELIQQLSELVNELGWIIALPAGDDMVPGLIIGQEEFVKDVVETYYGPNFTTFEEDPTGEGELIETPIDPNKKPTTLH